jgi:hypothetical protein
VPYGSDQTSSTARRTAKAVTPTYCARSTRARHSRFPGSRCPPSLSRHSSGSPMSADLARRRAVRALRGGTIGQRLINGHRFESAMSSTSRRAGRRAGAWRSARILDVRAGATPADRAPRRPDDTPRGGTGRATCWRADWRARRGSRIVERKSARLLNRVRKSFLAGHIRPEPARSPRPWLRWTN